MQILLQEEHRKSMILRPLTTDLLTITGMVSFEFQDLRSMLYHVTCILLDTIDDMCPQRIFNI